MSRTKDLWQSTVPVPFPIWMVVNVTLWTTLIYHAIEWLT